MRYEQTLIVSQAKAEKLESICQQPDTSVTGDSVEYDEEVVFEDGMRMAIQVCASGNPAEESCWTQGVLFDQHGNERGCTDVGESFLGEYCVPDGDNEYVTLVRPQAPVPMDFRHAAEILDDTVAYLRAEHVLPCDESEALAEAVATLSSRLRVFGQPDGLRATVQAALREVSDSEDLIMNGAALVVGYLLTAASASDGA